MPDLVIEQTTCHFCISVWVYEWDGQNFQSLARKFITYDGLVVTFDDSVGTVGGSVVSLEDTDHNGTVEIILTSFITGFGDALYFGPWRQEQQIIMWDGMYYRLHTWKYSSPAEFRFQAVQDGDIATDNGDYDEALQHYQDAVFNDKLLAWSEDIRQQILDQGIPGPVSSLPTPIHPSFILHEYEQLAAYARYRIMLLHLRRGWDGDAQVVYETLQQKFPQGTAGFPYAEMAGEFWNEYQSSGQIATACSKAVAYAQKHPNEILRPLEGNSDGFWTMQYLPEKICPFLDDQPGE